MLAGQARQSFEQGGSPSGFLGQLDDKVAGVRRAIRIRMYLAGEDPGASLGEEAGYQRLACPVAPLSQRVFRGFDPLDSVRALAAAHEVAAEGVPVGCLSWVWRVSLGRLLLRSPLG